MNNLGIQITVPESFNTWTQDDKSNFFEKEYYSNLKLFEERQSEIQRYKTILIDEIQDYKRPWMDIIKSCFLEPGGEYVLFGDEKQNIYDNELENKDIKTNVQQRPSEMKDCFRSDKKIKNIAVNFQKRLFINKYDIDDFNNQLSIAFDKPSHINYIYISPDKKIDTIFSLIRDISKKLNEHPNDIAALGFTIKLL
jgi:superfamily I DNA/RNA helicase